MLAVIGAITAFGVESRERTALLALLGCTALVVPAAQFHEQTAWSLDKHLAYGIFFAAIAAGYGCSRLIRRLTGVEKETRGLILRDSFYLSCGNQLDIGMERLSCVA